MSRMLFKTNIDTNVDVWNVARYRYESWTVIKNETKNTEAFGCGAVEEYCRFS